MGIGGGGHFVESQVRERKSREHFCESVFPQSVEVSARLSARKEGDWGEGWGSGEGAT